MPTSGFVPFLICNAAGEQVAEGVEWAYGSRCENRPGRPRFDDCTDAAEFARLNPSETIEWLDPETGAAAVGEDRFGS